MVLASSVKRKKSSSVLPVATPQTSQTNASAPLPTSTDDPAASNAHLVIQAEENIGIIKKVLASEDPKGGIENRNPLSISSGGSGHPFVQKDFVTFFKNGDHRGPNHYYECKINMMHVGVRSAGMVGVPWRSKTIEDMAEHEATFPNNRYTETMHINVGVVAPSKVDISKGNLARVSPPEMHLLFGSRRSPDASRR